MYYSCNICPDGCSAESFSSSQSDPCRAVSVALQKESETMKILQKQIYYSNSDVCSGLISSSQQELNPSRDNGHTPTKRHPSAVFSSCGYPEGDQNSGHEAKRARVESIIKGMTSSPGMQCADMVKNQYKESDSMEENDKIQEKLLQRRTGVSGSRGHSQMTKKYPQSYLSAGFDKMDVPTKTLNDGEEEKYQTLNNRLETSQTDDCLDLSSELDSSSITELQGWKKVKLKNNFQSKPERIKLMANVLKFELSRAVSRSVDFIFESTPLLQTSTGEGTESDAFSEPSAHKNGNLQLSHGGNTVVPIPDVQTEALSLVVQKPQHEKDDEFVLQPTPRIILSPKPQVSLCQETDLCEDKLSEKSHFTACQHALSCLQEVGPVKLAAFNTHWSSSKVRSKVNSRRPYAQTVSVDPLLLERLCLPHVKIESDSLMKNNLYMLNEGLTTSHLKKAKLMFFYTRYPSSMVLKMCFHDVQFTRCITSQLIKWFSNFREFFYIQMEKFARHALIEGSTDVRSLTVGRESELFRALNTHYNKANDFQVPDRFLDVAEITLREFVIAISLGKDCDPSWKKAIYKVICKLDSDVPAEFKHHRSV
ncbi:prospero homeobox protein 1-like [Xyrichtys novacula]|uniref:Prospero homeobox protein 1-like n=1 Tax=Xyrichtys novacula TaxID=13765 RepID=A0AAV1GZU3_XYRNO|nr:prospero homeobox protein 1-like [Xyrichtys novacula]